VDPRVNRVRPPPAQIQKAAYWQTPSAQNGTSDLQADESGQNKAQTVAVAAQPPAGPHARQISRGARFGRQADTAFAAHVAMQSCNVENRLPFP
jgi:hypothetical protein